MFKSLAPGTVADHRLAFLINNIKDQADNLLGGGKFDHVGDINSIKYLLTKSVTNAEQVLREVQFRVRARPNVIPPR
jgi:hypothetical protein